MSFELFTFKNYAAYLRMIAVATTLTLSSLSALATNNSCAAALGASNETDRPRYVMTSARAEIFDLDISYKKLTRKPNEPLNYYDMVDLQDKFMVHISSYGDVEVLLYPNYRFSASAIGGSYGVKMERYAGAANPPEEGFYIVFKNMPADFAQKAQLYATALNSGSRYALTCTTAACATLRELQVNPLQKTRVSAATLLKDLLILQANDSNSIETYYLGYNIDKAVDNIKSDRISDAITISTKWTAISGAISALAALIHYQF